jgi:hypothetical protein
MAIPGAASPDRRSGCSEPTLCPVGDGGEDWFKRATSRCQSIAHAHWWTRIDEPFNNAFGLELSQAFGEHTIADARYAREQLIETSRRRNERFDDRPGPALAYQLYRALKGRAVVEAPSDHGE